MKIFLFSFIVLLSANLMIDLLDSNMHELLRERNESIENLVQSM